MNKTKPLSLVNVYQDETMLRRAFSWLARIGAGPKFGSRPIGWYQMHMCAAIDELLRNNIFEPVNRNGVICQRGTDTGIFVGQLWDIADRKSRNT